MTLPSDWMNNAASALKTLLGTWQDNAADASGEIGHFEIVQGATCHLQCLASAPWQASKAYLVGSTVHANGNVYRATVAGTSSATAPSHTSGTAADGGVTWQFVQSGTDMTVDNGTVVAGQQITVSALNLGIGGA